MTRSVPPLVRTALSGSDLWCWQATLQAFGITVPGNGPQFAEFTFGHLRRAGYTLSWLDTSTWDFDEDASPTWRERRPTLNRFIAGHSEGDFIICTAGHIMALRDGKLTDTDLASTGRRLVQAAYSVERATKMTLPTSSIVPPARYRAHLYRRSFGHIEKIVTRTNAVNALASLFGMTGPQPEYIERWNRPHSDSAPWRVWLLPDLVGLAADFVGQVVYQNEFFLLVTNLHWTEPVPAPESEPKTESEPETDEQLLAAAKMHWPGVLENLTCEFVVSEVLFRDDLGDGEWWTPSREEAERMAAVAMLAFYQKVVKEGSL